MPRLVRHAFGFDGSVAPVEIAPGCDGTDKTRVPVVADEDVLKTEECDEADHRFGKRNGAEVEARFVQPRIANSRVLVDLLFVLVVGGDAVDEQDAVVQHV